MALGIDYNSGIPHTPGAPTHDPGTNGGKIAYDHAAKVLYKHVSGTTWEVLSTGGGGSGGTSLIYTALLTQSGTDAPVANVLQNTLGGEVAYAYSYEAGRYEVTLPTAWPANKVATYIGPASEGLVNGAYAQSGSASPGIVIINTGIIGSGFIDDELFNTLFEIRVFP